MIKIKPITVVSGIFIILISLLAVCGGDEVADSASTTSTGGPTPDTFTSQGLAGSYIIDILMPENAGDKTLYIKNPKGEISATWECTEHGHQVMTNVSFDGEVLKFNALSGTPGTEYFYYSLDFYGDYLLGYCKTQDGPKSPVVARAVK